MVRRKPTEEQLRRDRLRELVSSASWPDLEKWVSEQVIELYKRFESCKGDECIRTQGALEAYKRILNLKKGLRSDEIVGKSLSQEED